MGRAFSDGEDNYELWLGEYSQSRAHKIWSTLRKIRKKLSFSEFTYDCNCIEGFPAEISKYILQLWDRRSVTHKYLAQSPTNLESGSADPSGISCQLKKWLNLSVWPASVYGPSVLSHSAQLVPVAWLRPPQISLRKIWTITWHSFGKRLIPSPPPLPTIHRRTIPPRTIPPLPTVGDRKDYGVSDFSRLSIRTPWAVNIYSRFARVRESFLVTCANETAISRNRFLYAPARAFQPLA